MPEAYLYAILFQNGNRRRFLRNNECVRGGKMLEKMIVLGVALVMVLTMAGCLATVPDEPTYPQTLDGDFRLTISVVNVTIRRGKDIEVEAVFENAGGKVYEFGPDRGFSIGLSVLNTNIYDAQLIMGIPPPRSIK